METQTDRVVTMGYLLQELPMILEEDFSVRKSIVRIFRNHFADRDLTEDRFENLFRELKDGREADRKKWEDQNKKWEEQNKKWEEWTKRWDEQTRESARKWEEQKQFQKRTEHRLDRLEKVVEELALAQKRTEERVEELALAQKRTEEALRTLTVTVKDIKKQLGGLAMTVGYGLEDKIIPYVWDFGKKEFGMEITTVDRRNLIYPDGNYDEINIYAKGTKDGHPSFIIGECKAQPGKKDFDRMEQMIGRVRKELEGDIHPFLAGYHFSPDVEVYARETYPHIRICKSFEFELRYRKRLLS